MDAATSIVLQPTGRSKPVRPRRRWCSIASSPSWAALMRSAASFDTTIVRPWTAWPSEAARIRLSFLVGSSPCSRISLRCRPLVSIRSVPPLGSGDRLADVATVGDPQLLDGPDHRPGGPSDVVEAGLVLIELLHHHQRDHRVGPGKGRDRVGIRDEHRSVQHHPGGGRVGRAGARLVGQQIGQRTPNRWWKGRSSTGRQCLAWGRAGVGCSWGTSGASAASKGPCAAPPPCSSSCCSSCRPVGATTTRWAPPRAALSSASSSLDDVDDGRGRPHDAAHEARRPG